MQLNQLFKSGKLLYFYPPKPFLIMKLVILLTVICLQVSASAVSQQITISEKNIPLEKVFKSLRKQTGYSFFYKVDLLQKAKPVSLNLNGVTLEEALSKCFEGQSFTYEILNKTVIIKPKAVSKIDKIQENRAAQLAEITGKVTSEAGEPLIGVTVVLKGTTMGSSTDVSGNYSLNVPDNEGTLVFSYIGFETKEVAIGNATTLNVTLSPDAKALEEVVVVGYGEQKKETLTGSVVQVTGDDIVASPTANVTTALAGRLPGLVVNQRSGEPGRDDPAILIRGTGTLGNNAPLIIIDGVERSQMGRLNPEDIESYSVIKDASAAIYGARAANGVIIITTKRGALGKPEFNLSLNQAFNKPTRVMEVLDGPMFAQVYNEGAWYRAGRPANWTPVYSEADIKKHADGSDPILYPNTNWVDEVLKSYSLQSRMNLSLNGGTESIRYFLSFGTMHQDGNFRYSPTSYKQNNFRAKIDVNVTKDLNLGVNISGMLNKGSYPSTNTSTNFINILNANPLLVARYPNGLIAPGRLGENPLLQDKVGTITTEEVPIFSTFTAAYTVPFVEGLKVSGTYNYDMTNRFEKTFRTPYFFHEYNVNTQEYDQKQATVISTPELTDRTDRLTTSLYNLKVNYDRTFDKHTVGLLIGTEQQKNTAQWVSAYRRNFISTAIDQINVGSNAPEDKNNGGSASFSGYNNYFGRLNYNYSEKYLVEFVFRYDGSQIFPEEKRYGFFPAFSAGWRLSEENFIKDNLTFVDQLKLRLSHGKIGNDKVGQFQYLQTFSFGDNYVFGGRDVPGIFPNTMPNPNITWEESKKTDFGFESSLWRGLLGIDLTFFQENRSNILAARNLSISNIYGFSGLPDQNIGKVRNHGYEIVLSHRNSIGDFDYNISANTSFARSKVEFLDEVPPAEPYQALTGRRVGSPLYYKADGIFNTQEELDSYPRLPNAQLGDIKVVDVNGDGLINAKDQVRFDYTATPEYVFGMTLGAGYKNFDLNVLFQGQTNVYNLDTGFRGLGGSNFSNAAVARAKDRWTVDNPNGTMPRADDITPSNNTFWVYDASFVRLKSLELGYTLPKNLISKVRLGDVRLYVSGFNLLTFAKNDWADPEISSGAVIYPQLKVLNLGANIKF